MSVATLSESRTYDRILEFTRERVMPEIHDLVFNHSPLLSMVFGRLQNASFGGVPMQGRAKNTVAGGESIRIQHNLGKNTTAKTLTGPWDMITTDPSDTVRHSRSNWRHYSAAITVSDTDLLVNRGPEAINNLVRFESENALRSVADLAGDHAYSATGATQLTGLDTLIGTGTVQSLAPATYPVFASRGLSARGTAPASVSFASGSFVQQGIADMRTCYLNASEGAQQPEVILTDYTVFARYENSLQAQERYRVGDVANAGFQQLAFKNAPVFPDSKATSGSVYFINWNALSLEVLAGADLTVSPFRHAEQQEARVANVMLKCNLCVKDRRLVNRMTGVTA